jgi:4'-phosphopantetheinyl transferase
LGARGKPALATAPKRTRLEFNLSHSGDLALFAFARSPVGVDVEVARPGVDVIALAGRVFGPEQVERLKSLGLPEREREFLRAWVRHEAVLKCRGAGIGTPADERGLWLAELDVGSEAAAAVALEGVPEELCLWDWAS